MPFLVSSGSSSSFQSAYCAATSSRTMRWMLWKVSVGLKPSAATSLVSLSTCCLMPATRISKNSSRFELKMERNLTRSSSGWVGSCASSRTRRLNSSQLSSRLMKFFGSPKRSRAVRSSLTGTIGALSSVSTLDCACAIFQDRQSRAHDKRASGGRRGGLVANVFGCGGVNRVLRDVGGMISDALETARNKNQIQITPQLFRVLCHPIRQLATGHLVHVIEILVPGDNRAAKIDIFAGKRVDRVLEHRHRVRLNGANDFNFGQRGMSV